MHMVGRDVIASGQKAVIQRWEPYGSQMCDALVRFEDGSECWYASHDLRPDPERPFAGIPLASRLEACRENDRRMKAQLEAIQVRHRKELAHPWPGCEFGKAHIGNAIALALDDVDSRINR